jgi:hypothetical protein
MNARSKKIHPEQIKRGLKAKKFQNEQAKKS